MDWKPNNLTREAVGEFLESMVSVLPGVMGIDEVIAGCRVVSLDPYGVGLATYPRYIQVALRDRYYQDIMYRGGLSGLAVGDYVTVVHMRDGNRYELMTAGGSAGVVVNPAPAEADYVVTAGDPLLTNAHVAQDGQWTAITAAAGTFQTDFHPDKPVVVTGAGVVTEYDTIQAAITAAVDCDTVLVPPGDYTEDITLKNGVCVKGFGPRAKVRILGDEDVVTTAVNGWLENVTVVATDPPSDPGGLRQAIEVNHATGTCHFRSITIEASSTANAQDWGGINTTGAGSGLLIADDLEIVVGTTQVGSNAFGIRFADSYELELKNFKITVANTGGGAGDNAYGIMQMGSAAIEATEGWLDVTATGAAAADLFGTITYSEIVDTSSDTLFGQNVWLLDGNAIGIDGNERLIFNAAGNATFAGVTSVVVPPGCWVGADAACSWVFDSAAGDVTTLDGVGIGTTTVIFPVGWAAPGFTLSSEAPSITFTDVGTADQTRFIGNSAGNFYFGICDDDGANVVYLAILTGGGSFGLGTVTPIFPVGWVIPGFTISSQAPNMTFTDTGTADKTRFIGNSAGVFYFGVCDDDGANPVNLVQLDAAGHLYPSSNKTQALGLPAKRWSTIYSSAALSTGTSRLIESTKDCPACGEKMVRGTGGVCVVGEIEDYLLAFCPVCGTAAMEPIRHLPETQISKRKPPPKVELVGIKVVPSSGLSYQVYVDFKYMDANRGIINNTNLVNSTVLSEPEIETFFALLPKEREEFLLCLGEREWYASEEVRLMKETVARTQVLFDAAISDLVGTDLLQSEV